MSSPFERARRVLEEGLQIVVSTELEAIWWMTVEQLVRAVEAEPLLGPLVRALDPAVAPLPGSDSTLVNTYWAVDPDLIPTDPDEWGRAAWRSLRCAIVATDLQKFVSAGPHPLAGSPLLYAAARMNSHRTQIIEGYLRPLVRWLLREIDRGAALHASVERWVRRTEWTGPRLPEDLVKLNEDEFQRDLQRFLFDQGVEFAEQGREHHGARGRVDFLLRSGEPVAVELKVWRGDESPRELRGWAHQARSYPRDFGITTAYLVILGVSTEKRLAFGQGYGPGGQEQLVLGGVTVHVRLADLGRLFDSKDHGRRVVMLDASDLDPDGAR